MAVYPQVPELPDLARLIALLADKEAGADYLAKLEALADEIAMGIEIKGTVDEIRKLKAQTEADRATAERVLTAAHEDAERVRVAAARVLRESQERAAAADDRVATDRAAFETSCRLRDDRSKDRAAQLDVREAQLAEAQVRVTEKEHWAETTAHEYREKLAKLREFAATV